MNHHEIKRPGLIGRIALALLLAWALAMIVPDFRRVWDPLASVGFYANSDGLVYDENGPFERNEQSPSWRIGIRNGDRLDLEAMRCQGEVSPACGYVLAVLGGFEYLLPNTEIAVKLEPGSLLLMGRGVQTAYQHALPKRASAGRRINLTFRAPG